jgi:serine/threonine protein kinase
MPLPIDPICLSCGVSNPPNVSVCRVCGAPFEVLEFLAAKTRVGHFEIEKVLGRGGFGITYKAQDVSSGTTVALKELMPEGMASRGANGAVNIQTNQTAEFEEIKTKFIAEAQLLRKITDAASAKFIDLVAQNQTLYMAMDFVKGITLESRIASGSLLSVKETRSIFRDVLGVLEEMHDLDILHRDIKPANIILQPGGAKLIDFGSGIKFQKNKTIRVTSRVLTPAYAPLELYGQNIRLSPAADLYSLAATIYEAMTGVRIPSALERANGVKVQSLSKLEPSAPEGLVNAIDKALEIRVDARPKSVREFRELLDVPGTVAQIPANQNPLIPISSSVAVASGAGVSQTTTTRSNLEIFITPFAALGMLTALSTSIGFLQVTAPFFWISLLFFVVQYPLGWILVEPIRSVFDWWTAVRGSPKVPRSFYTQSMLGLYCLGIVIIFIRLSVSIHSSQDLIAFLVLSIAGSNFLVLIYLLSTDNKISVPSSKMPFWGLPLMIPALAFGWFAISVFQALSAQAIFADPKTITASSGVTSNVQPPATISIRATAVSRQPFTNAFIGGSKQICKKHLGNPLNRLLFKGTFLIPLDDESFTVSNAIAARLETKVLPCWDAANNVRKFAYLDNNLSTNPNRVAKIISEFNDLRYQFIIYGHWLSRDGTIVFLTAKPIVGSDVLLEQTSYREDKNFLLVSTAALKPTNYKTSPEAKWKFLERVAVVIKLQQTQDKPEIKNLEALDKLWRK